MTLRKRTHPPDPTTAKNYQKRLRDGIELAHGNYYAPPAKAKKAVA